MARLSVLLDPTKTGRPAQDLESKLRSLVVGQEEAIHEIVKTYQTHLAGMSPTGRPIANFLFLGPNRPRWQAQRLCSYSFASLGVDFKDTRADLILF